MKASEDTKLIRCIRKIVGIMLVLCMMISVVFIVAEAGHHCEDEDCAICACLQMCEKHLNEVGSSPAIAIVIVFSMVAPCLIFFFDSLYPKALLREHKVRLNN